MGWNSRVALWNGKVLRHAESIEKCSNHRRLAETQCHHPHKQYKIPEGPMKYENGSSTFLWRLSHFMDLMDNANFGLTVRIRYGSNDMNMDAIPNDFIINF